MSEHRAAIRWVNTSTEFKKGRYSREHTWSFDGAAVGPRTIDVMKSVNASVLAIESGRTVILDRDQMLDKARSAGIAVVALNKSEITGETAAT